MSTRNFKKGTSLFLDLISTFTTYELFPYDNFIFYTVLNSIISLDRVSLKQKVVDALEILTVIGNIPHLSGFLNSLYDCQYKSFFSAFEQIKLDRYLHPHFRYYMREVRTVVYSQFLESYKGVTLEAMAKAFGVTVEFIDLCLAAKGEESSECQRFAKYYWSPCLGEWTRNATGLVAPAIIASLGTLTHTLGTLVPVIGASGFAITAAATVIGIIVGSFR